MKNYFNILKDNYLIKNIIMIKNLLNYFKEFEDKYINLSFIDNDFYSSIWVKSFISKSSIKDKSWFSEEWYRARFVYMMVKSWNFPIENICVEAKFPKWNWGKAIKPDIVVFKDKNWIKYYSEERESDKLREKILVVFEAKNHSNSVDSAIKKQLEVWMERYIWDRVYWVYFDNKSDILIFKKLWSYWLKRYYSWRKQDNDELAINNRDTLSELPKFENFLKDIEKINKVWDLMFEDLEEIDQDTFTDLMSTINRLQDELRISVPQDLIVEFLTLKVYDEKTIKKLWNTSKYYILESEKNWIVWETFRKRIKELYDWAKKDYPNVLKNQTFKYNEKNIPNNSNYEKFLVEFVKIFELKSILKSDNENFNQIIFNNFWSSVDKAKDKQFFTPVPLVKAIVEMVNPQIWDEVCDPCSWICDFLAMSFKHMYKWTTIDEASNFFGFDKDEKVLKLAELNLVLNWDWNANLNVTNSITDKLLNNWKIIKNNMFTKEYYNVEDWSSKQWEEYDPKKYNVIITNPPFGKGRDLKISSENKANIELYETWKEKSKKDDGTYWELPKSMDMWVLFLENAYKLLKEWGRMWIVLSNSIASIKEWQSVRKWFISKMRIVALFDLPSNTFGETGVATTIIIAYKPRDNEKSLLTEDYEVYIKEIENIGYEVKTKDRIVTFDPKFIIDEETFENTWILNEDFSNMISEFKEWMKWQRQELKKSFNFKYSW